MSPPGGGDSDPVPSRLQLAGDGNDMLVLESSSSDDKPGDSRADCPAAWNDHTGTFKILITSSMKVNLMRDYNIK